MFQRLIYIIAVILAAYIGVGAALFYRANILNTEIAGKLQRNSQQLAEMNYRLGQESRGLKNENQNLTETLSKQKVVISNQERLTIEQQKLIYKQSALTEEQKRKLDEEAARAKGLETELGGVKAAYDELKKTGGEPLPKDFINSLLQATGRVKCLIAQSGNTANYRAGSGSVLGRYEAAGGELVVMTNAHVAEPNVQTGKPECRVVFGFDSYYKTTALKAVFDETFDFAFLKIGAPVGTDPPEVKPVSYSDLGVGFCEFKDVEIGDAITILSFPKFEGPLNAVSEGKITSILNGPVYEASATIDSGSSGGVAILNKKQCALGMPTWKGVGTRLGLSYIQSWPMMLNYVGTK